MFVVSKRLRAFRNYFFTGGGRNEKRQLPRWFPTETVARQGRLLWICVHIRVQRRLGERGICPQCRRFRRKRALQMQFPVTTPLVKMRLERSAERDKREIENNFSAEYG